MSERPMTGARAYREVLARVDDEVMGRTTPERELSDDPEVDRLVHVAEHGDDPYDVDGATDEEYEIARLAEQGNGQAGTR